MQGQMFIIPLLQELIKSKEKVNYSGVFFAPDLFFNTSFFLFGYWKEVKLSGNIERVLLYDCKNKGVGVITQFYGEKYVLEVREIEGRKEILKWINFGGVFVEPKSNFFAFNGVSPDGSLFSLVLKEGEIKEFFLSFGGESSICQ